MKSDFDELRLYLHSQGAIRKHVSWLIDELTTHFRDRYDQARQRGEGSESAAASAKEDLGGLKAVAEATLSRPTLISWSYRHPILGYALAPFLSWLSIVGAYAALMVYSELTLPPIVIGNYFLFSLVVSALAVIGYLWRSEQQARLLTWTQQLKRGDD